MMGGVVIVNTEKYLIKKENQNQNQLVTFYNDTFIPSNNYVFIIIK